MPWLQANSRPQYTYVLAFVLPAVEIAIFVMIRSLSYSRKQFPVPQGMMTTVID